MAIAEAAAIVLWVQFVSCSSFIAIPPEGQEFPFALSRRGAGVRAEKTVYWYWHWP
jgi:hypothetical protein